MYLVCQGGETISEVVKFTPEFGSWLIGNSVQKGNFADSFVDGLILIELEGSFVDGLILLERNFVDGLILLEGNFADGLILLEVRGKLC